MYTVGVDIGGMSIKVGLVDEEGKILAKNKCVTAETPDKCIDNTVKQINNLLKENGIIINNIKGIGIGCPGTVYAKEGVVDYLTNLKGWKNIPIVEKLKNSFDTEIKISNDANVATIGEVKYGCAKGYKNVVMFTLGTGVGGGVVIDGKLFEGGWSHGAELGHTTLIFNGEQCACGRKGCIERYVSATALMNLTKQAMLKDKDSLMWKLVNGNINNVDGKVAFEAELKGDKSAKYVVDTYIMYLAESIMNMLNIFRPEVFVIGGGVSAQGENLRKRLEKYLEDKSYGFINAPKTEIRIAELQNDAGIIGAASLI